MSIPGNCLVKVKCKTHVSCDVAEKQIVFQPLVEFMGDSELTAYESVGTITRGKSQFVNIAVYNPSPNEVFLKQGYQKKN